MNAEDYVSFECAKLLKEKGFDEPCREFYTSEKELGSATDADNFNNLGAKYQGEWFSNTISAPTLWQAAKWLREKHNFHVDVCVYADYAEDADGEKCDEWQFWAFDIINCLSGIKVVDDDTQYETYESALAAGIEAALKLI